MRVRAGFAAGLKSWRARRGLSQLALALAADVSQRHVSFLELGRTAPSREMVLRLAAALGLTLRQQNALLVAAGQAPVWPERGLGTPELGAVRQALDFLLAQQEPFPAFVVDRRWNLLRTNIGGGRLVGFLTGGPPFVADPAAPINLADALLAPDALRPLVVNWPEVAMHFVRGVQADALQDGTRETAALLERLRGYPDVPRAGDGMEEAGRAPVLGMEILREGTRLRLFTTLATLGVAQDVTVEEIRIECFFPLDDTTAGVFRDWAAR